MIGVDIFTGADHVVPPAWFARAPFALGRISGAMSAISLLARAAAPLVAAWWLLALPGYRELLLLLAALSLVALLSFALARPPGSTTCLARGLR